MALKAGIVGLPNVGKSTLFNCLSSAKAQAANFPFCTIDAQMGQVSVPDERLTKLAELVHPGRIVPAVCDIVDIAGLVKGASQGEGLGNQFLANIRECDAIIHVLRCFDDPNIVHVDGSVDPVRDKEIIDAELQLKDLETVENRIKKVEKQAKVGGDKAAKTEYEVLLKFRDALNQGLSARTVTFDTEEEEEAAKAAVGQETTVSRDSAGVFVVEGEWLFNLLERINLNERDSLMFFQRTLEKGGVIDKLRAAGCQDGNTVRIYDLEFDFVL